MNAVRETISAAEAGRRLGRGAHTIEHGLRTGRLPFGSAYKTAAGRYVYIIPKLAFEKYLSGEAMGGQNETP